MIYILSSNMLGTLSASNNLSQKKILSAFFLLYLFLLCILHILLDLYICQLNNCMPKFQVDVLTYFLKSSLAMFIHATFLVNIPPNVYSHNVWEDGIDIIKFSYDCRKWNIFLMLLRSEIQNIHYSSLTMSRFTIYFDSTFQMD